MQIIVTGHGHFASGLQSTVKLLAGVLKNVSFVDFTADMDEEQLRQDLIKELERDKQAVFFCDLFGGTPFKQAVLLKDKYPDIAVMAGGNVSALLEIALPGLADYTNAEELADKLMATAKAGIKKFKLHPQHETEEPADGI